MPFPSPFNAAPPRPLPADFVPGIYALNVHGSLSEEWVQYCEDNNRLYRAQLNQD